MMMKLTLQVTTLAFIAIFVNNGLVQAQSGYNYPRPDQTLGTGPGQAGLPGTSPARPPFAPQQPSNDGYPTSIATTPGYGSTGYPSGPPAFGTSGGAPGFPGSAPGSLPAIGYDDGFAGAARPNLGAATVSPFPGTPPSSAFPSGPAFGGATGPQVPFSTVSPSAAGGRPLVPGTRPTGPGFQGNSNAFGGSGPGSQGGFNSLPGSSGSTGGFGAQPGSSGGFGGRPGSSSGSVGGSVGGGAGGGQQGGNNGQYEGGDYSAIPGEAGIDYPIYTEIPKTSFDCQNQQWPGYYADVEAQCQVFHICAMNRTFDFLCPNGTVFSQQHLVCVWWNQFDCNSAPGLYGNNAYIYDYSQQGQQRPQSNGQAGPTQLPVGPPSTSFGGQTGPSTTFGGNTGPSTSFGGSTGPSTGFGGNRGPTGPSTSFGGNKGPSGPSTSFGGNTGGATGPSVIGQGQGGTGPSAVYPGATGPAVPYPGATGPVVPTATYPQGPAVGGGGVVYPGSVTQGVFPGAIGSTPSYPGSAPSATNYPGATTPAFGGYPSADALYPSPSPPNREYLPPARI